MRRRGADRNHEIWECTPSAGAHLSRILRPFSKRGNVAILMGYTAADPTPFEVADRILHVPMRRRKRRKPRPREAQDEPKRQKTETAAPPVVVTLSSDVVLATVLHHLAEFCELKMQGIGHQNENKFNIERREIVPHRPAGSRASPSSTGREPSVSRSEDSDGRPAPEDFTKTEGDDGDCAKSRPLNNV
eukprot:scaffold7381_cov310-Pinguiococcus_pyrenoidosus.AAC.55